MTHTTEPIEVITRYEKGKPDEYSFDGGKTFAPKPTEPTIDELVEGCFDDLIISNTGNYIRIAFGDKSMNVDYEHFLAFRKRIEALISDQVAKARIDELRLWRDRYGQDFHGWPEVIATHLEDDYEKRIAELEATLNGVKNK
jgi:hypothetical protein